MFTWFTREVAIFFFSHEAEKRKSGDLARGANRVHFDIFSVPFRVANLMVRLKLPYERQVSKMSIYLRTRRNKKSDSLLLAAQRRTSIVASCGCFKPMCESPGQRTLTQTKMMTPDRISNISKHESAFLMAYRARVVLAPWLKIRPWPKTTSTVGRAFEMSAHLVSATGLN